MWIHNSDTHATRPTQHAFGVGGVGPTHPLRLYSKGQLGREDQAVPVLVEKDSGSLMKAETYEPGDKIHFKTGSPGVHHIPNDSKATVLPRRLIRTSLPRKSTVPAKRSPTTPPSSKPRPVRAGYYRKRYARLRRGNASASLATTKSWVSDPAILEPSPASAKTISPP